MTDDNRDQNTNLSASEGHDPTDEGANASLAARRHDYRRHRVALLAFGISVFTLGAFVYIGADDSFTIWAAYFGAPAGLILALDQLVETRGTPERQNPRTSDDAPVLTTAEYNRSFWFAMASISLSGGVLGYILTSVLLDPLILPNDITVGYLVALLCLLAVVLFSNLVLGLLKPPNRSK